MALPIWSYGRREFGGVARALLAGCDDLHLVVARLAPPLLDVGVEVTASKILAAPLDVMAA